MMMDWIQLYFSFLFKIHHFTQFNSNLYFKTVLIEYFLNQINIINHTNSFINIITSWVVIAIMLIAKIIIVIKVIIKTNMIIMTNHITSREVITQFNPMQTIIFIIQIFEVEVIIAIQF